MVEREGQSISEHTIHRPPSIVIDFAYLNALSPIVISFSTGNSNSHVANISQLLMTKEALTKQFDSSPGIPI